MTDSKYACSDGARPPQARPDWVQALHRRLLGWYAITARDLPWRGNPDPYCVLVSEVMLQQTGVGRVLPVYNGFLEQFPTVEALAQAPAADVIRAWGFLGYNRRAVNLQRAAQVIVQQHGGVVPQEVDALLRLPGIGPYTAAAIACFAFGKPVAVVDTNIRRILGRLFAGPDEMGLADAWRLAGDSLPDSGEDASAWNQAMMDLGATICTATTPKCAACPLQELCAAAPVYALGRPADMRGLPRLAERRPAHKYYGTRRYYRGRIVHTLREAEGPVRIADLGPLIRSDYTIDQEPWLRDLIASLERDGLLRRAGQDVVGLP